MAADNKGRIDKKHGFMQNIIKIQVDRDDYDKKVRASATTQHPPAQTRHRRKPDRVTYVPPHRQKKDVSAWLRVEYEHNDGNIYHLTILKEEDIEDLVNGFSSEIGLSKALRDAFILRLKQESTSVKHTNRDS